jgi:hypothetical protein
MLSKLLSKVKQEKKEGNTPSKASSEVSQDPEFDIFSAERFLADRITSIIDYQSFKVGSIDSIYYIPDYISEEDAQYLNRCIYTQPKSRWSNLPKSSRRL